MGLDPVSWALIIGTVVSAAGTAASIDQQRQAQKDAKATRKEQEAQQLALQRQYQDQTDNENAGQVAQAARERQRALAASMSGQKSTIHTSSLGETAPAPVAHKTLLGA